MRPHDILEGVPDATPDAIRESRLAVGMTQADAARAVDLGAPIRWNEYEAGRRNMDRLRWAAWLLATGQHPKLQLRDRRGAPAAHGEARGGA